MNFFLSCSGQKVQQKQRIDSLPPPEGIVISSPTSVTTKISKDKSIVIILTNSEKIYIQIGDSLPKNDILKTLNTNKQLNLSPSEIAKLMKVDSIGIPFRKLKIFLSQNRAIPPTKMSGIPNTPKNNELTEWLKAAVDILGVENLEKENLLIKGDPNVRYPAFKNIKQSLKVNNIFRFHIVTTE